MPRLSRVEAVCGHTAEMRPERRDDRSSVRRALNTGAVRRFCGQSGNRGLISPRHLSPAGAGVRRGPKLGAFSAAGPRPHPARVNNLATLKRNLFPAGDKNLLRFRAIRTNKNLPNTHVPVVVCRSAGIWTRGQLTVLGRPAAGGEPAYPAQRGTRLEATTDRAFLVSAGPPKVGDQRGLSILPGVRTGFSSSKRWLVNAEADPAPACHGHGSAADRFGLSPAALRPR
jgi:hypothetical protein